MQEKPVFVYHERSWRPYRWTRELLEITTLGDVIPVLSDADEAGDRAADHVYSLKGAEADIVALRAPDGNLWQELEQILNGNRTRPDCGLLLVAQG